VTRGRPQGSKNIPWDAIVARLRRQPNTWMLFGALSAVPDRTIATIRRRERHALRLDDGVIRVRRKATVVVDDRVLCTLYVKFETKEKPHAE
jgi:hypothetical protein